MEAPAVTRRRRPFLAPLWLILLAAVTVGAIAWSAYRSAGTTLVVLVRSPERQPGTIADPPVSPDGEARAQRLARLFGEGGRTLSLEAIYASDDRRAQQTVAPLAERLHRAPLVFSAGDIGAAAARVLREHGGGRVLVVGAGDSVAQMAQVLAGADAARAVSSDPDALYVVSIPSFGHAQLLRINF
jgi:broad specificity phosphatase PhoE